MKHIAAFGCKYYFRGVEFNGKENIPTNDTPFMYAVNHQNSFLDAIIVGAYSPVPTYFLTRSDVFVKPFLWILDALKMMPIYRMRDGYDSMNKNEAVFEKCKTILNNNKAILIFPEGNHGLGYYLRPLKKGLARIVLQAQDKVEKEIKIIPVGLNYFDHLNSGHKLIVNYGEPIDVSTYLNSSQANEANKITSLTSRIQDEMRATLVVPSNSDKYDDDVTIFQRSNEHKRFSELKTDLEKSTVFKEERKYPLLAKLGLLFGFPNFLPLWISHYLVKNKVSQIIFYSSIKVAIGIILFPIWLLICFLLFALLLNFKWAIIVTVVQFGSMYIRRELVRLDH